MSQSQSQPQPIVSLEQARQLVSLLEQDDVAEANRQTEALLRQQDNLVYQQVGVRVSCMTPFLSLKRISVVQG